MISPTMSSHLHYLEEGCADAPLRLRRPPRGTDAASWVYITFRQFSSFNFDRIFSRGKNS
jgi:hypothetical protein